MKTRCNGAPTKLSDIHAWCHQAVCIWVCSVDNNISSWFFGIWLRFSGVLSMWTKWQIVNEHGPLQNGFWLRYSNEAQLCVLWQGEFIFLRVCPVCSMCSSPCINILFSIKISYLSTDKLGANWVSVLSLPPWLRIAYCGVSPSLPSASIHVRIQQKKSTFTEAFPQHIKPFFWGWVKWSLLLEWLHSSQSVCVCLLV